MKTTKKDLMIVTFVMLMLWLMFTTTIYFGGIESFGLPPGELLESIKYATALQLAAVGFVIILIVGIHWIDSHYD